MLEQLFALALAVLPIGTQSADADELEFTPERAEHLFNRAAFGVTSSEAKELSEAGLGAALSSLFEVREDQLPFYFRRFGVRYTILRDRLGLSADTPEGSDRALRDTRKAERALDRGQLDDYTNWWLEQMVAHTDPLRDRMTLFWHGYFTSSQRDVRNSFEMLTQHQLLRREALGSFREMLHGIARDPAMLEYLDNDSSSIRRPNENFARELLELFTLGEGNYEEEDILEAARAFVGWTDEDSTFLIDEEGVDRGQKTFLGRTGSFDGNDILNILLEQPACAEHVAGAIVTWLEGLAPGPERRAHYGQLLLENDYQIRPLLSELFRDPEFFRAEAIGQRIAGPVDLLVGQARRLGVKPPAKFLSFGSEILGQRLFYPPSVKGWDGGRAWITTATLMQRGNLSGVLTGQLQAETLQEDQEAWEAAATNDQMDSMGSAEAQLGGNRDPFLDQLEDLFELGWQPRLNLSGWLDHTGARSTEDVVSKLAHQLLAISPGSATLEELGRWWQVEGAGSKGRDEQELALRRMAYLILALPEAQLH